MRLLLFLYLCLSSVFASDGKIVIPDGWKPDTKVDAQGIIIDFKDDVSDGEIESFEKSFAIDVQPIRGFFKTERWTLLSDVKELTLWLKRLASSTLVESVEPNYIFGIYGSNPDPKDFNDPFYKYQWHMAQIGLKEASKFSSGKGAIVAVIDTGVAFEKYDKYNVARDLNETEFVAPYNFLTNNEHANDDHGHGTHVAGTIAQSTNNSLGVVGVAPSAKIMPLKVLDASGRGSIAGIARAIRYAADNGAHVINMSLGGPLPSRALRKALQYADSKGVISICAAGNSGKSVGYPAKYAECLAVSAVQYDEKITFYSSRGPEIEIAAPGGNVRVDQNKDGYPDGVLQNTVYTNDPGKDDYMLFMGTSMAAPHVAGAAALLVAAGISHPERIKTLLKEGAKKRDNPREYGSGILDVSNSLKMALVDSGWSRIILALVLGGLLLRKRAMQFLHPLSLIGLTLFSAGLFPLANYFPVDEFCGILAKPVPEWDIFIFGPDQGSALFRSSFFVLLMAGFFYQFKSLRPFFQGVGLGLSAFLLYSVYHPTIDLAYVPEEFYGETMWYVFNAWLAVVIAKNVNRKENWQSL